MPDYYVINPSTKRFVKEWTSTYRDISPAKRKTLRRYTKSQKRTMLNRRYASPENRQKKIYEKLYKEAPELRQRALEECPNNTEACLTALFRDIPGVRKLLKRGTSVSFQNGDDVMTVETSKHNKGLRKVRHSKLPKGRMLKLLRKSLLTQQDAAITAGDTKMYNEITTVLADFGSPESGYRDIMDLRMSPKMPEVIYLPCEKIKETVGVSSVSAAPTTLITRSEEPKKMRKKKKKKESAPEVKARLVSVDTPASVRAATLAPVPEPEKKVHVFVPTAHKAAKPKAAATTEPPLELQTIDPELLKHMKNIDPSKPLTAQQTKAMLATGIKTKTLRGTMVLDAVNALTDEEKKAAMDVPEVRNKLNAYEKVKNTAGYDSYLDNILRDAAVAKLGGEDAIQAQLKAQLGPEYLASTKRSGRKGGKKRTQLEIHGYSQKWLLTHAKNKQQAMKLCQDKRDTIFAKHGIKSLEEEYQRIKDAGTEDDKAKLNAIMIEMWSDKCLSESEAARYINMQKDYAELRENMKSGMAKGTINDPAHHTFNVAWNMYMKGEDRIKLVKKLLAEAKHGDKTYYTRTMPRHPRRAGRSIVKRQRKKRKRKKTYKADTVPASGTTVPNPQQHPVAVSLGPMAPPPVRPPSPPPPPQQSDEVSILTSMNLW